ncbi:rnz [Symbiodinium necroappetens]|uniref:Rnz protein n=1 Tax=Symbiodinium necroappetens TaxID=1628268 RepID=A0A812U9P2_9DINO|nr:rnz [Symbiodinium necroappetens]
MVSAYRLRTVMDEHSPEPIVKREGDDRFRGIIKVQLVGAAIGWALLFWVLWEMKGAPTELRTFDPYDILGVQRGAELREIKKAYHTKSLQHHPDKDKDNPLAPVLFQQVSKAYAALTDDAARKNYEKRSQLKLTDRPFLAPLVSTLVPLGVKRNSQKPIVGDRMLVTDLEQLVVVMTGTGTPVADPDRAAQGISVFAGGEYLLFDTGPGVAENMAAQGMPRGALTHVFFTHYHSDHIGDFGEVMTTSWVFGRTQTLQTHGPEGLKRVVGGFAQAYGPDMVYRRAHHTAAVMPTDNWMPSMNEFTLPDAEMNMTASDPAPFFNVYSKGDLKVQAFRAHHEPVVPAVGYKVSYKGRSVVIGGDSVMTRGHKDACRDVDVCILDAIHHKVIEVTAETFKNMDLSEDQGASQYTRVSKMLLDTIDYHSAPWDLVELAKESRPSLVIPIHMVPSPTNPLMKRLLTTYYREPIERVSGKRNTEIKFGEDGMAFILPANSQEIQEKRYCCSRIQFLMQRYGNPDGPVQMKASQRTWSQKSLCPDFVVGPVAIDFGAVVTSTIWNEDDVLFKAPGADEEFFAKYGCEVPALSGAVCRDVSFHTEDLQRPLALAMGATGFDYDLMGAWALWWLLLTLVAWVGVTIHDLALIGQSQKDFVLDVSGVNKHCPCIRSVWKFLAGYRPLVRLANSERFGTRSLGIVLAVLLAPVLLAWNLVVLLFIICPLILFAFMRYPIRMSRAWVFIISVACVLYGSALTMQQLAFVARTDLRPRYALTWEAQGFQSASLQTSLCTCGCDYSMSLNVSVNLAVIGLVTTVKSAFLAFRCLKGLRRSQWANLLSVTFPVPLTVYTVDWQQADGQPIRFRTKEMPVQGEVAFDPFAMMDEQPDSAYTTVHLRPERVHRFEKSEHGELRVLQPSRRLEMPGMPVPSKLEPAQFKAVIEAEYIGCCGFPWPTGGKKFVYDEDFLDTLERGTAVPHVEGLTPAKDLAEEEESDMD